MLVRIQKDLMINVEQAQSIRFNDKDHHIVVVWPDEAVGTYDLEPEQYKAFKGVFGINDEPKKNVTQLYVPKNYSEVTDE